MSVYLSRDVHSVLPNMKAKDLLSVGNFIKDIKNHTFDPNNGTDINFNSRKCKVLNLKGGVDITYVIKNKSVYIVSLRQHLN